MVEENREPWQTLACPPPSLSAPYTDHHRHTWITPTLPLKPPTTISYSRKKQDQLHNTPGFLGLSFPLMAHTLGDTLKNKQMAMLSLNHTQKWLWHVFLQIDHVHFTVCIDQELLTPDVSILPYSTSPSEIPPPTDFPKWPNVRSL